MSTQHEDSGGAHGLVAGMASAAATQAYGERHRAQCDPGHFRIGFGLMVSSIGVGTARGAQDDATDRQITKAVGRCIAGGLNHIDTAANYRAGRSERSAGAALREAFARGATNRAELIIATKGGYLPLPPGTSLEHARRHLEAIACGASLSEVVGGCHCLHPAFLAHELSQSRANLGLETIDIYYVHNPEEQLRTLGPEAFHDRMRRAFAFLEEKCAGGAISRYGLATWYGLRVPAEHALHLDLSTLCRLASEAAGGPHHFEVLQAPLNPLSPEILVPTQILDGHTVSTVNAAGILGLAVVASASLGQGQSLAPVREILGDRLWRSGESDAERSLQFTRSLPQAVSCLAGVQTPPHVEALLAMAARPALREDAMFASLSRSKYRDGPEAA